MSIKIFADTIDHKFRSEKGSEVKLFRQLCYHLKTTHAPYSYSIKTEEYHGVGHLVKFPGDGIYADSPEETCELADIMIIIYSGTTFKTKMVLIQAKKENSTPPTPHCDLHTRWKLDTHQWYLLSQKPDITGCGGFSYIPYNLLSSAIFPSIGSYLFFYETLSKETQMFYTPASNLYTLKSISSFNPRGKSFNFQLHSSINCTQVTNSWGHKERQATCSTSEFIYSLLNFDIGEDITPSSAAYNLVTSTLCFIKSTVNTSLANHLKQILKAPSDTHSIEIPFKQLLLINIEQSNS